MNISLRALPVAVTLGFFSSLPAQSTSSPGSSSDTDKDTVVLSPFEVNSSGDIGYVSTSSAAASRVGSQLKDITQTIMVLNEELIDDIAPLELNDILRYASTVDVAEGEGEQYEIRGFNAGVPLTNGFRVPRKFPSDTAGVERVEVLAGPASVLYGNVFGIGGVINRVTKKPKFKPQTSVQLRYASDQEQYGTVFDTTAPFGNSEKVAYRVIFSGLNGDRTLDHSYLNRYTLMPKLQFNISKNTKLLIEADIAYIESGLGINQGLSYDYILYRTAAGDITRATSTGGQLNTPEIIDVPDNANPDANVVNGIFKNRALNFQLTSELSDHWSLRVAGLANGFTQLYNIPGTAGRMNADGLTINRNRVRQRDRELGNYFIQADVAGRFDFGETDLLFVGGTEYSYDYTGQEFIRTATSLPAFNFFDPDYSVRVPDNFAPQLWNVTKVHQWAAFGMGRLSFFNERFMVNAGARVLDFNQTVTASTITGRDEFDGETTVIPKWGAIYRITPDVGLYYGHGEGYQPSTSVNPDGSILPPVEGVQDEFGLKLAFLDDRIQGSIAYFELARQNILEADPEQPDFLVPVGEVTGSGWDATFAFAATDSLQLIGGVSSVDIKTTYSLDASEIGLSHAGNPDYRWKLWARYKFSQGALDGLAFGVGTNYVAKRDIRFSSGTSAPIALPSWQIYDAMVSYRWNEHVGLQLNVNNLGDTLYYPSGNGNRFKVGSPRRVSFSMTYRF